MNRKITPEICLEFVWLKSLVVALLLVRNGMSIDFEASDEINGIIPGDSKSRMTQDNNDNAVPSFSVHKKGRFYRFPQKLSDAVTPMAMPVLTTETPTYSQSSQSNKPIVPDEGGNVNINHPKKGHRRIYRRANNRSNLNDPSNRDTVSSKMNSNSVRIPEEGGVVHVGYPDYVKYGLKRYKRYKNLEDMSNMISATTKDLSSVPEKIPGKDNVASNDSKENYSEKNLTSPMSPDEAGAITSEQTSIYIGSSDYPFFAAVHTEVARTGDVNFDDVECSGGIVNKDVVVTSCSCIYAGNWPMPLTFVSYYVTVGHQKFASIDTPIYQVETVKFHPSCEKTSNGLWLGNIAMLQIEEPGIQFGKTVQPMNLPELGMWEASDVLAKMSDQRRHCRVIGWSCNAPLIDMAVGKLIPLDECANPVCKKHLPCPNRSTVNGFMVEITPNEPSLLPGALLYCSEHVFAVVNTERQCATNNIFATCSPEELLYSKFNFELTDAAREDMAEYKNTFSKSIEGWETNSYTEKKRTTSVASVANHSTTKQEAFVEISSLGAILFPFYVSREASWIYTNVFAAGYYVFVFK